MKKSDVWNIQAGVLVNHLVQFEEEVTADEAREKFLKQEGIEDILDEEIIKIGYVASVGI